MVANNKQYQKRHKHKPKANITPDKTPTQNTYPQHISKRVKFYQLSATIFLLVGIIAFAIFIRAQGFSVWQKNLFFVKYQNEYQMVNFDSYYYLQLAKDLKVDTYTTLDKKRQIPNGVQNPKIPPLLPLLAANISKISNTSLATVAIFIPVLLSPLLAIIVFLLGLKLGLNKVASLSAALFSVISAHYVMRTSLGVFDTDSLNVVFTLLNSYFILCFALNKNNNRYWFLALGLINTLLYFMWWDTAISVVILSAFIPFVIAIIFFYKTKNSALKYYLLGSLGLLILYFLHQQIIEYAQILFSIKKEVFPLVGTIKELNTANISDFIAKTTNSVIVFMLALIGIAYFIKQCKTKTLLIIAPILLSLLPFIAGNRFTIFAAPILALGLGFFIQLLFHFKNKINIIGVYTITIFVVLFGVYNNYTVTDKLARPAAADNRIIFNALKKHTPINANIWTNWDIAYQIRYYLQRGSFADGKVDSEIFYYLHFPLAADNLALSANFINFYNTQGRQGMHQLFKALGTEINAFEFLQQVLSLTPEQAKKILATKLENNKLPIVDDLTSIDKWLAFLYPMQADNIYLLLHQKMLQTMAWFSQGNIDLKTGETKGLTLFLSFNNLKQKSTEISNKDIKISKKNGNYIYANGIRNTFSHILTYNNQRASTINYPKSFDNFGKKDERFVFEWNKNTGFGAAMSTEVTNTTFNKLFMRHNKSKYFQPIKLATPYYQIWKVQADSYSP